jgi:hypothetical protein
LTGKPKSFVNGNYAGATFTGNLAWAINTKVSLPFPEDKQAKLEYPKIGLPENDGKLPQNILEMQKMELFKPNKNHKP